MASRKVIRFGKERMTKRMLVLLHCTWANLRGRSWLRSIRPTWRTWRKCGVRSISWRMVTKPETNCQIVKLTNSLNIWNTSSKHWMLLVQGSCWRILKQQRIRKLQIKTLKIVWSKIWNGLLLSWTSWTYLSIRKVATHSNRPIVSNLSKTKLPKAMQNVMNPKAFEKTKQHTNSKARTYLEGYQKKMKMKIKKKPTPNL